MVASDVQLCVSDSQELDLSCHETRKLIKDRKKIEIRKKKNNHPAKIASEILLEKHALTYLTSLSNIQIFVQLAIHLPP